MREPPLHDRSLGAAFPEERAGGAPFAIAILVAPWQPAGIGARRPVRDADAIAWLGADRIDRALNAARVRATFLIDPLWAQRHPADALRLAARHEIGVLGYDARRPSSGDPARGAEALGRLTGVRPRFFLPSRGAPCPPEAIRDAGLRDARALRVARLARYGPCVGAAVLALCSSWILRAALARDRAGRGPLLAIDASAAADLRGLAGAPLGGFGTGARVATALAALGTTNGA